jgi:hypothetical protein
MDFKSVTFRTCKWKNCLKEFRPSRKDQMCCSKGCQTQAARRSRRQLWSYWSELFEGEATTNTARGRIWDITSENFKKYMEGDSVNFTPSQGYQHFIEWMEKEKILCKKTETFFEIFHSVLRKKIQTDTQFKEDSLNVSTIKATPEFKRPKPNKYVKAGERKILPKKIRIQAEDIEILEEQKQRPHVKRLLKENASRLPECLPF